MDQYSNIRNWNINQKYLDKPTNENIKTFFYLNLSAQTQAELIVLPENEFKKILIRQYESYHKVSNPTIINKLFNFFKRKR